MISERKRRRFFMTNEEIIRGERLEDVCISVNTFKPKTSLIDVRTPYTRVLENGSKRTWYSQETLTVSEFKAKYKGKIIYKLFEPILANHKLICYVKDLHDFRK